MSDPLVPRTADAVARMYAAARATYGDDAPQYVWDEVCAVADRHVEDSIRVLVRASGTTVPVVKPRGRPGTDPAVLEHIRELRAAGKTWKAVATAVNARFSADYDHKQVRDLERKNRE